jgi:hypothetical protein
MKGDLRCTQFTDDAFRKVIDDAPVSSGTRELYHRTFRRVKRIMGGADMCDVLNDPERSFARLAKHVAKSESDKNEQALLTIVGVLMSLFKHSGLRWEQSVEKSLGERRLSPTYERWHALMQPLNASVKAVQKSGKPTVKQALAGLAWETVVAKNVELSLKHWGSMDCLLSNMYVLLRPRRQSDYYDVYIARRPEDKRSAEWADAPAVLDMTLPSPLITVREYKTRKAYGAWSKELPSELVRCIKASLRATPRSRLFVRPSDGGRFETAEQFGAYHNRRLKEWFGNKKVTNNSLRHAYATMLKLDGNISMAEHEEAAKDMGHSLLKSLEYAHNKAPPGGTSGAPQVPASVKEMKDGKLSVKHKGKEFICTPKSYSLSKPK